MNHIENFNCLESIFECDLEIDYKYIFVAMITTIKDLTHGVNPI